MLRRLDDADRSVVKQAHGARQETRGGDEIGVEDRDELRRFGQSGKHAERVVDVAGLGVGIVRPGDVAGPSRRTACLQPGRRPSSSTQMRKFG